MEPDLRARLEAALGGAYAIERELGGGGMSHVFLAREAALGRSVVVKLLPPEQAAGLSVERFRREVRVAAGLQHPHIVPLLTAGMRASSGAPGVRWRRAKEVRSNRGTADQHRWTRSCPRTGGALRAAPQDTPARGVVNSQTNLRARLAVERRVLRPATPHPRP